MRQFDSDEQLIFEAISGLPADSKQLWSNIQPKTDDFVPPVRPAYRLRATAILVAAAILITGTAFAVTTGSFQRFLERINPAFSAVLEPVELLSEVEGIRMEVVAAQGYGNHLLLYLTMQDTAQQGRIDEHSRLRFHCADARAIGVEQIAFEETSKIATYEVRLAFDSPHNNPLTISVSRVSHRLETLDTLLPLPDSLPCETILVTPSNGDKAVEVLMPGTPLYVGGGALGGFAITGIGYINGNLHVQVHRDLSKPQDLYAYLKSGDNSLQTPAQAVQFYANQRFEPVSSAGESFFSVEESIFTPQQLAAGQVYLKGYADTWTDGDWSVTLNIGDYETKKTAACHIEAYDCVMEQITVHPLGLDAKVRANSNSAHPIGMLYLPISLVTEQEGVVLTDGSLHWEDGIHSLTWEAKVPIDISLLSGIIIGETFVPLVG
jgi:hypothetical protein